MENETNHRVNVFWTVDTELWSFYDDLKKNIDSGIYGLTAEGEYGLGFQIELFDRYGIKANFFVEPLFSTVAGINPLKNITRIIRDSNHDVQLHIHTEWLAENQNSILRSGSVGNNMKDFSKEEQSSLVDFGLRQLDLCGVSNVCAFRAGNYGGNFDTIAALRENGVDFDTTYNIAYLEKACDLTTAAPLCQPSMLDGVCEFPITCFVDFPGHYRHLQITACSLSEMKHVLLEAYRKGWYSVVIVSHSFEMIARKRGRSGKHHKLDPIVLGRFEGLCRFLSENGDKFISARFSELVKDDIPDNPHDTLIRSSIRRTAARYLQQIYRRMT